LQSVEIIWQNKLSSFSTKFANSLNDLDTAESSGT